MWRKIQEKGLSTLYVNDHLFRKNIKKFLSDAIHPPISSQMDQIMEIFKYFEDNFIGKLHRNIRNIPYLLQIYGINLLELWETFLTFFNVSFCLLFKYLKIFVTFEKRAIVNRC
ncbi:hypothetical protein HZS_3677 [Henneguya salminicola]|nr:hypothetical protein HZS_3677 [Henneguya salminicola]